MVYIISGKLKLNLTDFRHILHDHITFSHDNASEVSPLGKYRLFMLWPLWNQSEAWVAKH